MGGRAGRIVLWRMEDHELALLLLGGDRGPVQDTLARARLLLSERAGAVLATSRDHWTEPWGFQDEALFLNKAILLRTTLSPEALLEVVLGIERDLGRVRTVEAGYGPRTIDIDILLHGGHVIDAPHLGIPHPLMHRRHFALAPAADVAPGMVHPVTGRTVLGMLDDLRNP
jgi:2-amino-4-hydroxy-6-hydroxymethyldihydropteridine diphosphokinase